MPSYAGVGPRQTPEPILELMTKLASCLKDRYTLRSGGAKGADTAFEQGALPNVEIFLPWESHVHYLQHTYLPTDWEEIFVSPARKFTTVSPKALEIAERFHPRWGACSQWARLLHGRNSHIMLGRDLESPVEFVVCWTQGGKKTGGTGQALRLAEFYKIPIYNLEILEIRRKILENMYDPSVWCRKEVNFFEV